jgi:anti-anti-sigma factor
MTSLGTTSRQARGRPGAGPPAARTVVRLQGALDVAAAPALRERLIGLLNPGTRLLVLDLSRVSSCDSAGLVVLIGAQRRARVLGIVMRLAAPSVPVAKLLRLTGLDRSLTLCPDLRGALAAERHEPANPSPQVLAGGMAAGEPEVDVTFPLHAG